MARILVVDDEKTLVKGLIHNLEQEGFEAKGVYDGITALEEARTGKYNLMVLDLMLPGLDGFSVCRKIRQESDLPIIMLTARGEDLDIISGLEMGADDYLSKPFNVRELLARINAVLRRSGVQKPRQIKYMELFLDLEKRIFKKGGKEIELTGKEFDLLTILLKNPGRVLTRGQLIELVWGLEYADERTVDVNIRRIREKIERDPKNPVYVQTKWGVGYYLQQLG